MPYIREIDRAILTPSVGIIAHAGELNYALTKVIEEYRAQHGDRYQTFNDIAGALNNADKEFYRRVVVPYEDLKCEANGDVYTPPK